MGIDSLARTGDTVAMDDNVPPAGIPDAD